MVASCFNASSVNVCRVLSSNSCSRSRSPCTFDRSPVNTQDGWAADSPCMPGFLTQGSTKMAKEPFEREARAFYSYTRDRTWHVRLHNPRMFLSLITEWQRWKAMKCKYFVTVVWVWPLLAIRTALVPVNLSRCWTNSPERCGSIRQLQQIWQQRIHTVHFSFHRIPERLLWTKTWSLWRAFEWRNWFWGTGADPRLETLENRRGETKNPSQPVVWETLRPAPRPLPTTIFKFSFLNEYSQSLQCTFLHCWIIEGLCLRNFSKPSSIHLELLTCDLLIS